MHFYSSYPVFNNKVTHMFALYLEKIMLITAFQLVNISEAPTEKIILIDFENDTPVSSKQVTPTCILNCQVTQ